MTACSAERDIAAWLSDLGKLTAGAAPLADAKAKIATMAAALAAEFDARTFSRDSLVSVARQCKFFPTFGEACAALTDWRKAHPLPPRNPVITRDATMSPQDQAMVASWWRLRPERLRQNSLPAGLSVQRRWPAVFREICRSDPDAERIAVRRGWLLPRSLDDAFQPTAAE